MEYCANCLWSSRNILALLKNVTFVHEFTEVYSKYLLILFSFCPRLWIAPIMTSYSLHWTEWWGRLTFSSHSALILRNFSGRKLNTKWVNFVLYLLWSDEINSPDLLASFFVHLLNLISKYSWPTMQCKSVPSLCTSIGLHSKISCKLNLHL